MMKAETIRPVKKKKKSKHNLNCFRIQKKKIFPEELFPTGHLGPELLKTRPWIIE